MDPYRARSRRLPRLAAPFLLVLGMVAASCDSTSSSNPTTTPSTISTTTSMEPGETADYGPGDIDAYVATLGVVAPSPVDPTCSAPYVADELMLYVSRQQRNALSTQELADRLNGAFVASKITVAGNLVEQLNSSNDRVLRGRPTFRVRLQPGSTLSIPAIADVNRQLTSSFDGNADLNQVAVDVDYIGPFLPVGHFSPDDDPKDLGPGATNTVTATPGADHGVLVVDYPEAPVDVWDESWDASKPGYGQPDKKVDYVAGHGTFVSDIVHQYAPKATVTLQGVTHPTDPTAKLATWPGFLFSEDDLVTAVEHALGASTEPTSDVTKLPTRQFTKWFDVINFSLGTVGCRGSQHPVLEDVLRDILDPANYAASAKVGSDGTYFVAAVGNDGDLDPNRAHFPAAFAGGTDDLAKHVIAVGATGSDDKPAPYSNQPCSLNAWAPGAADALFPWLNGGTRARWNGTSFATARVTGLLANQTGDIGTVWTATAPKGPIGGDATTERVDQITCP